MSPTAKKAAAKKSASSSSSDSGSGTPSRTTAASEEDVPKPSGPPNPNDDNQIAEGGQSTTLTTTEGGESVQVVVQGETLESDSEVEPPKSELKEAEFYYPTHLDPMRKVPGTSVYLDDEQRREAEVTRARIEDREPDLDNPPAMQSTPLVEKNRLAQTNFIPAGVEPDVTLEVAVTVTD